MNNINRLMTYGAIAAFALTGCGASGGANAPSPNTRCRSQPTYCSLQSVRRTIYGVANAGLNVVTTYRQPAGGYAPGDSGTLVNSPTLTLPGAIGAGAAAPAATVEGFDACSTAAFGAGANEVGTTAMTSTSQTLAGFNRGHDVRSIRRRVRRRHRAVQLDGSRRLHAAGLSGTGTPFQVAPYPVPIYRRAAGCATAPTCDPNQMDAAWGGPPASYFRQRR